MENLLVLPSTRNVADVKHVIAAAASSSSLERAQQFLEECKCPSWARAYGSYEGIVADPNVDIIYIATPHSHHFQNAMLCLKAGKHVLCEKPFTVNAPQAEILARVARERKLFLMEAVWTRFFPLSIAVRKMVAEGKIGKIHRVIADNSFGDDVEKKWGTEHRMVNMDLAGGALLDCEYSLHIVVAPRTLIPVKVGVYSLTWVFQILYHLQPGSARETPSIVSSMIHYEKTGADVLTSMILTFPKMQADGIALTGLLAATDPDHNHASPSIKIMGSEGQILVYGPPYRPLSISLVHNNHPRVDQAFELPGHGMFYEADECARCIRDGKLESETIPLQESIAVMKAMDEVRKQGHLRYSDRLESTVYKE